MEASQERHSFLGHKSQDFVLTKALKAELLHAEPDAHVFFAPDSMGDHFILTTKRAAELTW